MLIVRSLGRGWTKFPLLLLGWLKKRQRHLRLSSTREGTEE